jgi:hypothetical protein
VNAMYSQCSPFLTSSEAGVPAVQPHNHSLKLCFGDSCSVQFSFTEW